MLASKQTSNYSIRNETVYHLFHNFQLQIGNPLPFPLPHHLQPLNIQLLSFMLDDLITQIEDSEIGTGVQALKLTIYSVKKNNEGWRNYGGQSRWQQQLAVLPSLLPDLKILRVLILSDVDNQFCFALPELFPHLEVIQIFHKDEQIIRKLQADTKCNNMKCIFIKKISAPITFINKKQSIPNLIRNKLTVVNKQSVSIQLKQHFLSYCLNIKKWNCPNLSYEMSTRQDTCGVKYEEECPFLPTIKHIQFSQLLVLQCQHCNVCSIQALAGIRAPSLISIKMEYNSIMCLRALIKSNSCHVGSLSINSNKVSECECLSEVNWPKFREFFFDSQQMKSRRVHFGFYVPRRDSIDKKVYRSSIHSRSTLAKLQIGRKGLETRFESLSVRGIFESKLKEKNILI